MVPAFKSKSKSATIASACIGALLAFSSIPAMAQKDYPDINLKFALYISSTLPQSQNFQWWADQLKERSNGKINIQFFWSESLGKANEMIELVESGAVDLSAPAPSYYPSKLPLTNVTQLPVVFPDNASAQLLAEDLDEIEGVRKENADNNIVPMFWTSLPSYHLLCTKEIRTMDDFKGKKMRSYGEYVPMMWEVLGAVGVTTTSVEVYEGLQRGLIDCSYLPDDFAYAYKLHEVADYIISPSFGSIIAWPVYMNAAKWESFPDGVKELFRQVSAEAAERDREEIAGVGEEAVKKMLDAGVQMVEFEDEPALREALPDFLGIWVEAMSDRGLGDAANQVADAARKRISEASASADN